MTMHSESRLPAESLNPEHLSRPAGARVRYVGFEPIDGGRRLSFSVKPIGQDSVDITFDISDALFKDVPAISIQDAAPMAYEKLVELLTAEGALDTGTVCLTEADVAQYVARHLSSQKLAHWTTDRKRRTDVAA